MNKKQSRFGWSDRSKALDIERQRALELDDIGAGDSGYTRGQILEAIQHLLMGSFEFNFNPLPQLRKYFPRLEWEYHCFEEIEHNDKKYNTAMRKMIASCDFFWPVHAGSESCWVTASRKDKVPARMKIFGRGDLHVVYGNDSEQLKFFKECSVCNWIEKWDHAFLRGS